jgi:hypothetical protein
MNKEIKCPYCGNPINEMWFAGLKGNTAVFVAECWSGNIETAAMAPRHYFIIKMARLRTMKA